MASVGPKAFPPTFAQKTTTTLVSELSAFLVPTYTGFSAYARRLFQDSAIEI